MDFDLKVTECGCPGGGFRPQSYGVWSPNYHYLQCSRTLGYPSITIYNVRAPWVLQVSLFTVFPPLPSSVCSTSKLRSVVAQVGFPSLSVTKASLFTVFPHPGLPKYHYLRCPALAKVEFPSLSVPKHCYSQCSRTPGSPSIAIDGVAALAHARTGVVR